MSAAVVIGGSAAGLVTALMLARERHTVDVIDQDDLAPAADVETAAVTAFRRAAPQLVHLHSYHAPARATLRERLPDVYAALLEAGAVESPTSDRMPATLRDRSPRPGDERLATLLARRSTLDWVLRGAAAAQPRLRLLGRTRATGLLARPGTPPRVIGARTDRGELPADTVIDASGRRSRVDGWLTDIGARTPWRAFAECGIAYYTRHYRFRPGAPRPRDGSFVHIAFLPFLTVAAVTADNGTAVVTLCPLAEDRALRALRDPAVHDAVVRTIAPLGPWLDVLDPISDVYAMGGLHNTLRRLVVDDAPVALGLHAVGDSVCTTNPTFGRGVTVAVTGAADLATAVAAHPDDPAAQARRVDRSLTAHVQPWYDEQATIDAARLATIRAALAGHPPTPLSGPADGVTAVHVRAAAQVDPDLHRAVASVVSMVRRPSQVFDDPAIHARTRAAFVAGDVPRPTGPTRAELLTAIETARRAR